LSTKADNQKSYSKISYISLVVGIICFFIVFVPPTRIASIGYIAGDYITAALTGIGIFFSVMALVKKTEKKIIPLISLILSFSFLIFWMITIVLLFTGQIEFAP